MPVYVDDMYKYSTGKYGRMRMSHMIADTEEELYAMADTIGVARKWVQHAKYGKGWIHFDIAMSKRELAIENGAIELTMRELAIKTYAWKQERRAEIAKKHTESAKNDGKRQKISLRS